MCTLPFASVQARSSQLQALGFSPRAFGNTEPSRPHKINSNQYTEQSEFYTFNADYVSDYEFLLALKSLCDL